VSFLLTLLLAVQVIYSSPVNYEVTLAGNFGEPRPNHFHGGIDVKTGQVEGKPIFSIGDGYVSEVTIGLYGFGNAVYVRHPEGYTSVYCHLKKFTPQIRAMVRRQQYRQHQSEGSFRFRPGEIPVSSGQLIAVSGNTGSSQAPHLHLEIHDNVTWNMLDPLEFLGDIVQDNTPPQAHGFMAYPQEGEGVFNGSGTKSCYGFPGTSLSRKFTAWGKVGFGLWANDYTETTYNNYGVRHTQLLVDGLPVFESDVNNIPVQANRLVNSWGDYEHYLRSHVWYMKSFIDEGNDLKILSADQRRGIIDFNEERDYRIEYVLSDFRGNSRTYSFTVTGERRALPKGKTCPAKNLLRADRTSLYQLPGMQLRLRKGLLPVTTALRPQVRRQPSALSDSYSFALTSTPLVDYGQISIRLNREVAHPDKLYIVSDWGNGQYMGGTFKDGWVTGKVRELAAHYTVAMDEEAPRVTLSGLSGGVLTVTIAENESGLASFEAFVDGQFVLFERVGKGPTFRCRLKDTPVEKTGTTRELRFTATDNRHNVRQVTARFVY